MATQNDAAYHGRGIRANVARCDVVFSGLQNVDEALRLLRIAERQGLHVRIDSTGATGLTVALRTSDGSQTVRSMATLLLAFALIGGEDADFLTHAVESARRLEADSDEA
jgi:hypothetical protein